MWRPNISNRAFDRMGERYAPIIDPYHFLGRSAFDIPWKKKPFPAVNIVKNGKLYEMQLAVPGFSKEEIEITVQDEILTIRGDKRQSRKEEDTEFIIEEFDIDAFERRFRLAPRIAREKISARYENGILLVTFVDVPEEEEKNTQTVKVE